MTLSRFIQDWTLSRTIKKTVTFQVLRALPWDKVEIEVILVELEHAGKVYTGSR